LRDISFTLHRGEILGVAGLVGAGRTTLARALFGTASITSGHITVRGRTLAPGDPAAALRAGLALVPEDRKSQGLVLNLSVAQNVSLPHLGRLTDGPLLSHQRQDALVGRAIRDLNIRTPSAAQEVRYLSGGNQQKVVLAKWLVAQPQVLILDEPTRGVDVGAKAEIYAIIRALGRHGTAILMISSELPELLQMADRILVMHEGRLTGEVTAAEATEETILSLAIGQRATT
jgi:rhamnose transport system ATP-binding protein